MIKFSNKLKKTLFLAHFGLIFPILRAKKFSPGTTSHGILATCQNLEKINNTIPRKRRDRWKDGRKDRQKDGRTDSIL